MSDLFKFELGETLKDKITGFEGVVMGRSQYFTDCNHYGLLSRTLKDGIPTDYQWFDETRVVRVENTEIVTKEERIDRKGATSGPFSNPPTLT